MDINNQFKFPASVLVLFIIKLKKTTETIWSVKIQLMFHSVDNSHFEGKGVNTNKRSHSEQQHNDRIQLF